MNSSRRSLLMASVITIAGILWWFYSREPLPLGYTGTAPNPQNIPGVRPEIECEVDQEFLTGIELAIDGQPVSHTGISLPRNKNVKVLGKLRMRQLPSNSELLIVELSVASKSKNSQGMLIEGETILFAGAPNPQESSFERVIDQEWKVPDHGGEFNVLLVFHLALLGERETPRRFAVVCPAKIE